MRSMMRLKVVSAMAVAGLMVSGCGGGDDSADETAGTSVETTTAEGLTAPGVTLELGQPATVEFVPNAPDPNPTSNLQVAVTSVEPGTIKDLAQFTLPAAAKTASVYYVNADVQNVGDGNLAGTRLVLFGKVSDSLVVPPVTLRSSFPKCEYKPFGKKFTSGVTAKVCMVILAPDKGTISEIQWRETDVEPISWPAS